MPVTSITKDPERPTLTLVADSSSAATPMGCLTGPNGETWSGSWKFTAQQTVPGMEEGLRAAMPQLDVLLAEQDVSATHA